MYNILVLMIDCLRQDRLEGEGKSAITPNLDAVKGRSLYFDNVHSVGSNTTAVMGSWFTGLYPYRTGLRSFRDRKFDADFPTLASVLKGRGYRTLTTVTEAMADAEDLLTGFDEIERRDKKVEAIHNGYGERVRRKLAELNRGGGPWFYFVHTCELHPDRQCAPEFRHRRYGRTFYDRALSSVDHYLGPILDEVDWSNTLVVTFGDHGDNLIWEPPGEFASKVMNRIRADGRAYLWQMRDWLYRRGLFGDGKWVLRHNCMFHHDYHVYKFLTNPPMMISVPGQSLAGRVGLPVSTIDMFPTLLEFAGAPVPPNQGVSLLPILDGGRMEAPERALYQEVVTDFILKGRDPSRFRIPLLRALIENDWKYISSPFDPRIQPELYNLRSDPDEERNLYPLQRETPVVRRLAAALDQVETGAAAPAAARAGGLAPA